MASSGVKSKMLENVEWTRTVVAHLYETSTLCRVSPEGWRKLAGGASHRKSPYNEEPRQGLSKKLHQFPSPLPGLTLLLTYRWFRTTG
jgi:hypothetical protein